MTDGMTDGDTEAFDAPGPQDIGDNPVGDIDGDINLDLLLDVPVNLAIEIGRTRLSIGDLMKLTPGSVVELNRHIGETHDVLINGTLIAHGEIVVAKDRFGIRFTDIVSPAERVQGLN